MLSDEQLRRFEQAVLTWYPLAKGAVLFYETEMGERATSAIVELRDVLDHFYVASSCDDSEQADRLIQDCLDHLRTVTVEPVEHAAEDRYASCISRRDRSKRWDQRAFRLITRVGNPDYPRMGLHEDNVKAFIRDGRRLKASIETAHVALEHFKGAYAESGLLEECLKNPTDDDRRFQVGMLAFSAVVGGIVTLLLTWLF